MMTRRAMRAAVAMPGLAVLLAVAGCTPADWAWMQRQTKYPDVYRDAPLGRSYDTQAEVDQLRDEQLRAWMTDWLELRETYLTLWRQRGTHDAEVRRIRNRMATYKAVITDRATQLSAMGQPLSMHEEYGATWR